MLQQTEEWMLPPKNSGRRSRKSTLDTKRPSNSRSKTPISTLVNQEVKDPSTGPTNNKLLTTGKPQLLLTKKPKNNGKPS